VLFQSALKRRRQFSVGPGDRMIQELDNFDFGAEPSPNRAEFKPYSAGTKD
jgi:hypothetical protein